MSAPCATAFARSAKQSSRNGQPSPLHSSEPTENFDQTCACGMNASSETSPVFVASAHASTSSTWRCWSSK
jgi:hypothetical protein